MNSTQIENLDLSPYSIEELSVLSQKVAVERERKNLLANAESRLAQLQAEVLQARDGVSEDGTPFEWVKPVSPTDAYPIDWMVMREGHAYRSKVHSNNYTPNPSSDYWDVVHMEEAE